MKTPIRKRSLVQWLFLLLAFYLWWNAGRYFAAAHKDAEIVAIAVLSGLMGFVSWDVFQGKNWARYAVLITGSVYSAMGAVAAAMGFIDTGESTTGGVIFGIIMFLLSVGLILLLLFRPSMNRMFKNEGPNQPPETTPVSAPR